METDPADSVLFGNATNATSDLTNALALDMTYRVLYYGTGNKVREKTRRLVRTLCGLALCTPEPKKQKRVAV